MFNSIDILNSSDYLHKLMQVPRPNSEKILAFYEHRVGAICKDAHLLLAPLDDHLCHRGDGVFESISFRNGRLFQLEAHMERMQGSALGLKMQPPCSWQEVQSIILQVAKAAQSENGSLRVLMGRGPGGFGISPTECPQSSLYVIALRCNTPSEAWYAKGLTACRSAIPAKQSYLAKIKNANYLPNVLMAEEAMTRAVDVAFSFDASGYLAEAAVANVAVVSSEHKLICPHMDYALSGTTITAALEVAKDVLPVEFKNIDENDLWHAKEILLFGSTPLCVGVTHYEGRSIGQGKPGEISQILRQRLMYKLWSEGTAF